MAQKIGVRELARLAKVSVGTVDRALNGRGEISEKTRRHILLLAEHHGYQPNLAARALGLLPRDHLGAAGEQEGKRWPCRPMPGNAARIPPAGLLHARALAKPGNGPVIDELDDSTPITCRARRKRERLPPNVPIRSDPAIHIHYFRAPPRPGHSRYGCSVNRG